MPMHCLALYLVVAFASFQEAEQPATPAALDHHGDALPPRAVARLGTERLLHPGFVYCLRFGPDGTWFMTGNEDGRVRVFDAEDGTLLRELDTSGDGGVSDIDVTPDGRRLVVGTRFATAKVFDLASGALDFTRPVTGVTVAWYPAGDRFAASDGTGRVVIVDRATAAVVAEKDVTPFAVDRVAVSPCGRWLVSRGRDRDRLLRRGGVEGDFGAVHVWHADTLEPITAITWSDAVPTALAFSTDGDVLYVSDDLGRIDPYLPAEDRHLDVRAGDGLPIHGLALLAGGDELVLAREGGLVQRVDPSTMEQVGEWTHDGGGFALIAADPTRDVLIGAAGVVVELRNAEDGAPLLAPQRHLSVVTALRYTPDGAHVASASHDGTVQVWEARTGRPLRRPLRHGGWLFDVDWWPQELRLASACRDGGVYVWTVAQESEAWRLPASEFAVTSVSVSPTGRELLATTADGKALYLEVAPQGATPSTPAADDDAPASFRALAQLESVGGTRPLSRFVGDGSHVVVAGPDLRLYATPSLTEVRALGSFGAPIQALAVSGDGRLAAVGLGDGAVRVVQVEDAKRLPPLLGLTTRVRDVAFAPDGRHVAAVSEFDDTIFIWRVSDGREVARWKGQGTPLSAIAFSPDGRHVATGGFNGSILIWDAGL